MGARGLYCFLLNLNRPHTLFPCLFFQACHCSKNPQLAVYYSSLFPQVSSKSFICWSPTKETSENGSPLLDCLAMRRSPSPLLSHRMCSQSPVIRRLRQGCCELPAQSCSHLWVHPPSWQTKEPPWGSHSIENYHISLCSKILKEFPQMAILSVQKSLQSPGNVCITLGSWVISLDASDRVQFQVPLLSKMGNRRVDHWGQLPKWWSFYGEVKQAS